mmetsp:Transcript_104912/g.302781  ORF Transcript_104912/g.302781 Transcript_104912/m.302781 type:complete len:122 (-) Transcript_104912:3779-4144(-)
MQGLVESCSSVGGRGTNFGGYTGRIIANCGWQMVHLEIGFLDVVCSSVASTVRTTLLAISQGVADRFGSMALAPFAPDNFGGKELISSRLDYVLEHKAKFVVDWYEEHQKHQSIRTNQYTT